MNTLYSVAKNLMFTSGLDWSNREFYLLLVGNSYGYNPTHVRGDDIKDIVAWTNGIKNCRLDVDNNLVSDWKIELIDTVAHGTIHAAILMRRVISGSTAPHADDIPIVMYDEWDIFPASPETPLGINGGKVFISPNAAGGDVWLAL